MSLTLIVLAVVLSAASGLPSCVMPRGGAWSRRVAVFLLVLACASGLVGACLGLFEGASDSRFLPWPSVGNSLIGLDPLSAFFLVPVFLVGAIGAIYSLGYWPQGRNRRTNRRLLFFYGLLVAGMALLIVARHAMAFLIGWEAMALSGFFLIVVEDERAESRKAGIVYLVATHIGTLTLFGMFALWRSATGSFELTPAAALSLGAMNGIFFMSLLGFGLKAGMMPLHFWLPGAHAAAPSHASAMLSGVVLKMGVYGLMRMLSLMPDLPSSWGALILFLGAVSGVLGVAFALAQHDIKKLLAYHSVENIGIILMGLGVAIIGRASARLGGGRELFVLGMAGCLLHVWNHSFFKSLLFLGAGSAVHATGTRAIDRLGGLAKLMPITAALFLVGAVAICGLPPLNGFVSELLIYLGLFGALMRGGAGLSLAAIAVPVLAMIGALALACFVKVFGAAFLGNARSPDAAGARESPPSMLIPAAVLAGACALIGAAPLLVAPVLDSAIAGWGGTGLGALPRVADLAPLAQVSGASAVILAAVLLVSLCLSRAIRRNNKRGSPSRTAGPSGLSRSVITWDCGYALPTSRMQYGASSFARGLVGMFAWALRPKSEPKRLQGCFPEKEELRAEVDEAVLDRALLPVLRRVEALSRWSARFQAGLAQQYVLYILVALALLMLTLVPFDKIIALIAAGR